MALGLQDEPLTPLSYSRPHMHTEETPMIPPTALQGRRTGPRHIIDSFYLFEKII